MLHKIFEEANKKNFFKCYNVFWIILLTCLSIHIIIIKNAINSELKYIKNKIQLDYDLTIRRTEEKAKELVFLLKTAKDHVEHELLFKNFNLLNHNDYLYLSFMPTKDAATNKWDVIFNPLTGINIYQKIYNVEKQSNILIAIDIDALMQELINNNQYKFYKITFISNTEKKISKVHGYLKNYFNLYTVKYELNLKNIFKYVILNISSTILMLFGWCIIYFVIKFKYKKLYKNKYKNLIERLNDRVTNLTLKVNNQAIEESYLKLKIDALKKTHLAMDFFTKDFIFNLFKKVKNIDYLKQQQTALVEIFPLIDSMDKRISDIIDEVINYHANVLLSQEHEVIKSVKTNIIIPGTNVFGVKKVLIVSLQYLLNCSPLGTSFELIVSGNEFSNLKIDIIEQDTFSFLEDLKVAKKMQSKEKFTDLLCVSWDKLVEISGNEKMFLYKRYNNKNRYIFITASLELKNDCQEEDNVYQIF